MINIFSVVLSMFMVVELISLIVLLKPIKEPRYIRDLWCNSQGQFNSIAIPIIVFMLLANTLFGCLWESLHYEKLLNENPESALVYEFRKSNILIFMVCLVLCIFLLVVIERLVNFLTVIARLIEFELMCRHAILTRDPTEMTIFSLKDR